MSHGCRTGTEARLWYYVNRFEKAVKLVDELLEKQVL